MDGLTRFLQDHLVIVGAVCVAIAGVEVSILLHHQLTLHTCLRCGNEHHSKRRELVKNKRLLSQFPCICLQNHPCLFSRISRKHFFFQKFFEHL